jgi:CRISPR-associated protein Cmr4
VNQANAILGLLTQTSLHAGAGSSAGAIDLPIQREGHNGWPCVFASAVKGALRTRAGDMEMTLGKEKVLAVFGPETNDASAHSGALAVGDARLLLLPVRSLASQFKWVTCPAALRRLQRDAQRLGVRGLDGFEIPVLPATTTAGHALVPQGEGPLFLEEYRFDAKAAALEPVIAVLDRLMDRAEELKNQLAIVGDDMFALLAQSAPPVNAHIALDSTTKTAREGALWYEETLPPETLLYCALSASGSRRSGTQMGAAEVLALVRDNLFREHPWLQLGGNETVGMGWCAVRSLGAGG